MSLKCDVAQCRGHGMCLRSGSSYVCRARSVNSLLCIYVCPWGHLQQRIIGEFIFRPNPCPLPWAPAFFQKVMDLFRGAQYSGSWSQIALSSVSAVYPETSHTVDVKWILAEEMNKGLNCTFLPLSTFKNCNSTFKAPFALLVLETSPQTSADLRYGTCHSLCFSAREKWASQKQDNDLHCLNVAWFLEIYS